MWLVRTRAVVALAQEREAVAAGDPLPVETAGQQERFRIFCLNLREALDQVLRSKALSKGNADAMATAEPSERQEQKLTDSAAAAVSEPDSAQVTRYAPTRWLLLSCYEATLSAEFVQAVSSARRESITLALFLKVTGFDKLLPAWKHAALDAHMLFEDAIEIHRRVGLQQLPAGHVALRRWLLGMPDAIALRCATHITNPIKRSLLTPKASARPVQTRGNGLSSDRRSRPLSVGVVGSRHSDVYAFGSSATRSWLNQAEIKSLSFYE